MVIMLSYTKGIGMDNGSESKKGFNNLCKNMGLINKVSNKWNLQLNAVLKQIHHVLDDGLREFDLENKEIHPNEDDHFDEYLNTVSYVICSAYHQTHGYSRAQLIFCLDVFVPVSKTIDWYNIKIKNNSWYGKATKEKTHIAFHTTINNTT